MNKGDSRTSIVASKMPQKGMVSQFWCFVLLHWILTVFLPASGLLAGCASVPNVPQHAYRVSLAKSESNLRDDNGTAEQTRPLTIREALRRRQLATKRYDEAFIDAVQARWYDLLDNISYRDYRRGKVVLQFSLHSDGRITDMKVLESTVTGTLVLLCEKAVSDPSPFDEWPNEIRLKVGMDFRQIQFTFHFN